MTSDKNKGYKPKNIMYALSIIWKYIILFVITRFYQQIWRPI